MAFQVYPIPQTAPLNVVAAGTSPATAFSELAAVDPVTTLNTMFIRMVKLGTGCAASGPPHPRIRLRAGAGDLTTVFDPVGPPVVAAGTSTPIFNGPGGTGTEVANAIVSVEANDVYLIRVFIFQAGSAWQVEIRNNDLVNAHGFTWVVADADAPTQQPWIDAGTALAFNVITAQAVPLSFQVANLGTGALTVGDSVGFSPGAGFAVTTVPPAVNPNACGNVGITFTGPAVPGASAATYTVTSNDTTAQLAAGHNRRVALSAVTGALEVVLLLDGSGSMNAKPNGDPIVAATDSRWSKAITASNQFLDLLAAFGAGSGRFGVARFPSPIVPCPSSADVQLPTPITVAAVEAAKLLIPAPLPAGGTPVADGIGRVNGTVPGSFGYFEAAVASQQFNRRWLVVLSDGIHNCFSPYVLPGGPTAFTDRAVKVITVGYGDPGATTYAPDHAQLIAIKNSSGPFGQFLDAGADDLGLDLRKSFRTAITALLTLDPTTDPAGVLTSAQRELRRSIAITEYESTAAFAVNWGTAAAGRVRVEVLTPNCELITPSVAQADPDIDFAEDPRYTIYTFHTDFIRNSSSPDDPRHGDWTLIISAELGESDNERFDYEVIFDSRLKMALSLDRASYFAGDPIVLAAELTLDGLPVTGASVTCQLTAPGQFANNWLANLKVTANELSAAKELAVPGDANALTLKSIALQRRGDTFNKFPNVTSVAMTDPSDDGTYRATFAQTTTPGAFDFFVTAVGATPEGVAFRREKRVQTAVDVRPDPICTIWDVVYQRGAVEGQVLFTADVRVFPRDCSGNVYLVDPDVTGSLVLAARSGDFVGPLVGNLDGSYTRPLRFTGSEQPVVTLRIADQDIAVQQPIISPAALDFADMVVAFKIGHEARPGLNRHRDPQAALGDIAAKGPEEFVALGGFGTLSLGLEGHLIVHQGDDDIAVFVRPDEELRPYRVEVKELGLRRRWVPIGTSPGVTEVFSLGRCRFAAAAAVRITDTSGRTRTNELRESETPGVSILGAGFRKTIRVPVITH